MSQFSAQEPSLGYHYQIRYALYLLLKNREKDECFVTLEKLDDVTVGGINNEDLHQTKFHNQKAANLTDKSVDIWKTIRVWSESAISRKIDLGNVLLVLVTTSSVSENSVMVEFTKNTSQRLPFKDILTKMESIVLESKNDDLKKSFDAFYKLEFNQKEKLINNISIRDNSLDFENLKNEIKKEIQIGCLPEYVEGLFQNLEGWWYEQCINHLSNKIDKITFDETHRFLVYLYDKKNVIV